MCCSDLLNVRPETVKLLEENIGEKLHDTGFGNDFLDITPKAQASKEKVVSWTSSKFKTLVLQRTLSTESRGNPQWEMILAHHI